MRPKIGSLLCISNDYLNMRSENNKLFYNRKPNYVTLFICNVVSIKEIKLGIQTCGH